MFRLNFSKLFSDFSLRKEKTDMFIHTWKNQHKNVYADFKSGIDKVADGDLTLFYNMYALMKDCVPPEAQSFYDWFGGLLTQSPTVVMHQLEDGYGGHLYVSAKRAVDGQIRHPHRDMESLAAIHEVLFHQSGG